MTEQLVFVGGSPRSGCTLLHRALSLARESHPPLSESAYLVDQLRIFGAGLQRFDVGYKDYFGERARFAAFTRELLQEHFRAVLARHAPASALILAHPEATPMFPVLAQWFPRAWFAVSVRDPRDAVASIMESGARHEAEGRRTPLSAVARDVRRACNLFKGAYANVLSPDSKGGERLLFVRYEEISAGNEQVARQAGEPCGLSFDADLAERLSALEDPDGGVGRHREVLGPAQVAEIQTRCADFNKVFPYW